MKRQGLAILGGFVRPEPAVAGGAPRAAFWASSALAESSSYTTIHSFQDPRLLRTGSRVSFVHPVSGTVLFRDRQELASSVEEFDAVFCVETEWDFGAPYALRPLDDWPPVVCEVGTAHSGPQWLHLFAALSSRMVRHGDALLFKSHAARRVFAGVIDEWCQRFGLEAPQQNFVIPQGVRCAECQRDENARQAARAQLGLDESDVMFLAFSRLSPGTKGDQIALIVMWREVVRQDPHAVLVLAGASVDRAFTEHLRRVARDAGVGARVVVVSDPHELWREPAATLMSAADALIHLSTGVEEVASLVVCEAMAHRLPVIAADWSGMKELVNSDTGFLVPTYSVNVPTELRDTYSMGVDTLYNVALARCAVAEPLAATAAVLALSRNRARRTSMGEAGRRKAEFELDVDVVCRQRLEILRDCAVRAEAEWAKGSEPCVVPLVDVGHVVATLSSRHIEETRDVRISRPENISYMPEWTSAARPLLSAIVEIASSRTALTCESLIRTVHARLSGSEDDATGLTAGDLSSYMRVCARLLAFDVLALVSEGARPDQVANGGTSKEASHWGMQLGEAVSNPSTMR